MEEGIESKGCLYTIYFYLIVLLTIALYGSL